MKHGKEEELNRLRPTPMDLMVLRVNFCTFVQEIELKIGNRKPKIEDDGKVHDLRFSNSVFRCGFAALGIIQVWHHHGFNCLSK